MKLKYFLRGLGSGVVITSIILTLSFQGRNSEMSEAEIIKRAEELGMVQEENRDLPDTGCVIGKNKNASGNVSYLCAA